MSKYKISNRANYIEKENVTAIYAYYKIIFLKGISNQYFNNIIKSIKDNGNIPLDIDQDFINYLFNKGILEINM